MGADADEEIKEWLSHRRAILLFLQFQQIFSNGFPERRAVGLKAVVAGEGGIAESFAVCQSVAERKLMQLRRCDDIIFSGDTENGDVLQLGRQLVQPESIGITG